MSADKTPRDVPNITEPDSIIEGIDQIEKSQTIEGLREMLVDFGYTEAPSANLAGVVTRCALAMRDGVIAFSITHDRQFHLDTMLTAAQSERNHPDDLLTLVARLKLGNFQVYGKNLVRLAKKLSPKRVQALRKELFQERRFEMKSRLRLLFGREGEATDSPNP